MYYVKAKVIYPAMHQWTDAHLQYAYLKAPHLHHFHVTVKVGVNHANRSVEINDLSLLTKEVLDEISLLGGFGFRSFGSLSCEQIAEKILKSKQFTELDVLDVEVLEDGVNGGGVNVKDDSY